MSETDARLEAVQEHTAYVEAMRRNMAQVRARFTNDTAGFSVGEIVTIGTAFKALEAALAAAPSSPEKE